MTSFIVFSGILNDRSKSIRIATQTAIAENSLQNKEVQVINNEISSEEIDKKIIKIAVFMKKLGNVKTTDIRDLESNTYAWAVLTENQDLKKTNSYEILYESKILYPWKLIKKK